MASAFNTFAVINELVVDGTFTTLKSVNGNILPKDGTDFHWNYVFGQGTGSELSYRRYILFIYLRQFQSLKEKVQEQAVDMLNAIWYRAG